METVNDVARSLPKRELLTIDSGKVLSDAVAMFKNCGISQLPVVDGDRLVGILTEADVLRVLVDGHAKGTTAVAEVMERRVSTVSPDTRATELPQIFERGEVALIVNDTQAVIGILTKLDLIEWMTRPVAV